MKNSLIVLILVWSSQVAAEEKNLFIHLGSRNPLMVPEHVMGEVKTKVQFYAVVGDPPPGTKVVIYRCDEGFDSCFNNERAKRTFFLELKKEIHDKAWAEKHGTSSWTNAPVFVGERELLEESGKYVHFRVMLDANGKLTPFGKGVVLASKSNEKAEKGLERIAKLIENGTKEDFKFKLGTLDINLLFDPKTNRKQLANAIRSAKSEGARKYHQYENHYFSFKLPNGETRKIVVQRGAQGLWNFPMIYPEDWDGLLFASKNVALSKKSSSGPALTAICAKYKLLLSKDPDKLLTQIGADLRKGDLAAAKCGMNNTLKEMDAEKMSQDDFDAIAEAIEKRKLEVSEDNHKVFVGRSKGQEYRFLLIGSASDGWVLNNW